MREESVEYYSEGSRVRGLWRLPDTTSEQYPCVIQGPGWMGLKDARLYVRYHEALTKAGVAVLVIDYRGFGDSEGNREILNPHDQVQDLVNGVTYLTSRSDVIPDRIGVFGSGGTGGGNAVMLAARDHRVACVVAQFPIADGGDWLKRMRSEYEWEQFLIRLEEDRRKRVDVGVGEMVNPRGDIMIPTAERRSTEIKRDVDGRVPELVSLQSAESILDYRPADFVNRIAPRPVMIICVEGDTVTPTDHALELYERAGAPKQLVMQRNTTHYAAYDRYWETVTPLIVEWFRDSLVGSDIMVRTMREEGVAVTKVISVGDAE